ncbi:protein JINGUBANG-like [Magnolia sinica]|uniref:protein JINGUBANG-like n=1 Tax=Magnolia sinica TaxID=86752 RepID=UPI002659E769|nr:protein JINGUBANG-like [Magnolia sinica]
MEFYGKRTPWSIIDEEERSLQSPTRLSFKTNQQVFECDPQLSPTRLSSESIISLLPSFPSSPWTLSPLHPPPTPSLLYQCLTSLHRHDGNIFSIAISKGLVFTGSESNCVRIWKQSECIERDRIKTNSSHIRAILAYNNTIFTAHKDRRIRVWTISISPNHFRSKKIATLPRSKSFLSFPRVQSQQHKNIISCLAYYHAEGILYTGSWDKTVKTWSLSNKKCVDSFVAHDDCVNAIVVNQIDGCMFTSSSDGSIKIWRRVYGESSHTLTMTLGFQTSPVNALAMSNSQNSSFLYSGSSDGLVNYWEKEAMSGRYKHRGFLQGHRFAVLCLVSIERLVFSGSEDTTIRVWRREEGSGFHTCLTVIEGHRGPVKCMAACIEMEKMVMGFLVYSASLDRTVKVWRIKVFVGEKRVVVGEGEKKMEHEISPVLSPSWVKKKLQGFH